MLRPLFFSLVALAACSAAPPPPPPKPPPPVAPPPPPPLPARWLPVDGDTFVGPETDAGTLLVLSGRRVLVSKSGEVVNEKAPAPEPIFDVIHVPTKSGPKLVASTNHAVLRLDDPVGAPTPLLQSTNAITAIGSAPGVVAVWTVDSETPRLFDVETGAPSSFKLPPLPARGMAFLDEKRGAVALDIAGLMVTDDGGATWTSLATKTNPVALNANGVREIAGTLGVPSPAWKTWLPIDVEKKTLGGSVERPAPKSTAPLVQWVHRTGRDPVDLAAENGLAISSGEALVAASNLVARVDLKTGAVLDLAETYKDDTVDACAVERAGDSAAWVACGIDPTSHGDPNEPDAYYPWGVMRVAFDGPKLKVDKPVVWSASVVELRGSPSGGVLFLAPCSSEEDQGVCVRQKDGTWHTFKIDVDAAGSGTNALADGRVVYTRATVPEDDGTDEQRAAQAVRVVAMDAKGNHETLLRLPITNEEAQGYELGGRIEEDADGTLHATIVKEDGATFVFGKPGGETKTFTLPGATAAAFHDGKAVALVNEKLTISLDGGATWSESPPPDGAEPYMQQASWQGGGAAISDVGVHIRALARVGWGSEAPSSELPKLSGTLLSPVARPAAKADQRFACKSEGVGQGMPPFYPYDAAKVGFRAAKPAPKGTRRVETLDTTSRFGTLDPVVTLTLEGKDASDAAPTKWTLRWLNPLAVGERARTVTLAAPRKSGRDAQIRAFHTDGARAVFAISTGGKSILLRVNGNGKTEAIDEPPGLGITAENVMFGADKGEPIAWLHDTALVAWPSGEAPRVIGRVARNATYLVGQPTKEGVPLLASSTSPGESWAFERVFPVAAEDSSAPLAGWNPAPPLARVAGGLDLCTPAAAKWQRFAVRRTQGSVEVDGASEGMSTSLFDVRVNGQDACIAGLSASLQVLSRPRPPEPQKPGKPAPKDTKGPVGFVRMDVLGKHADGGDLGVPPKGNLRKMTCSVAGEKAK